MVTVLVDYQHQLHRGYRIGQNPVVVSSRTFISSFHFYGFVSYVGYNFVIYNCGNEDEVINSLL